MKLIRVGRMMDVEAGLPAVWFHDAELDPSRVLPLEPETAVLAIELEAEYYTINQSGFLLDASDVLSKRRISPK